MNELYFVKPAIGHKQAMLEFAQEFVDADDGTHINGSGGFQKYKSYEEWLGNINTGKARTGILVPASTYFGVCADKIVGIIDIRHKLNKSLLKIGGHIGYSVRPFERRKGYASAMLALALDECKKLNIKKALVTCNADNIASARTIIKNGGIFENEVAEDNGRLVQRYWINLM
jgi:predicted acetyltransferase